ncbi:FAD binding domain-containing protein [Jimgerdemannia flammicorona]|uniref:FAD binding domain-containing protein n=1 Tax=Jimgerdemannia flammicorona TaxID=994334 RepID=A0A433QJ44_9FUNG|nr:FAD binding domain-containing protein [Jimgerdemannia flammicorona]
MTQSFFCSLFLSDKIGEVPKWGRADNLSPRNLEIFSKPSLRSIADELDKISHKVKQMSSFENGVRLGSIPLADQTCRYKSMNTVPAQSTIQAILEKRLNELGVKVERRIAVSDIAVDSSVTGRNGYPVYLTLDYLESKNDRVMETRKVRARYVIAADGARSFIRKKMGITFDGVAGGDGVSGEYHSASMDIKGRMDLPDFEKSLCRSFYLFSIVKNKQWGTVLTYPKGDLMKVGVMLNDDSTFPLDKDASQDEVFHKLRNILQPYVLTIEEIKFYTTYTINDRTASSFNVKNCVFLVGDSIHIQSPKTGQGLNLGFGDAYNLFWKLHFYHRGLAPSLILDTYERERREVAEGVKRDAATITKLQAGESAFGKPLAANDTMGKQVLYAVKRSKRLNLGTGVTYSENVINNVGLAWNTAFKLLPGERAPNGVLGIDNRGNEAWLYDRLVVPFAIYVLVFVGDPRSDVKKIDELKSIHHHLKSPTSFLNRFKLDGKRSVDVLFVTTVPKNQPLHRHAELGFLRNYTVAVDEQGEIHGQYGIGEETKQGGVYVVRPDDVVGGALMLDEFMTLEKYFDGFLIPSDEQADVAFPVWTMPSYILVALAMLFAAIAVGFAAFGAPSSVHLGESFASFS